MSVTERLIAHLKDGRPLTALSLRQTYGLTDIRQALWNIRIRGYHIREETVMTVNKGTGRPMSTIEYRLVDSDGGA